MPFLPTYDCWIAFGLCNGWQMTIITGLPIEYWRSLIRVELQCCSTPWRRKHGSTIRSWCLGRPEEPHDWSMNNRKVWDPTCSLFATGFGIYPPLIFHIELNCRADGLPVVAGAYVKTWYKYLGVRADLGSLLTKSVSVHHKEFGKAISFHLANFFGRHAMLHYR